MRLGDSTEGGLAGTVVSAHAALHPAAVSAQAVAAHQSARALLLGGGSQQDRRASCTPVCFMSNHWHGVVTDPFARLPEFLEHFHRLLAKAQNASLGRWENLWSSDKTSVVLLVSDDDVLEKMAYTIANPTAAGLVRSPREWPGVITTRIGERCTVDMPDVFFDPEGSLPETVALEFTRPPIYPQLDSTDAGAAPGQRRRAPRARRS